MADEQVTCKSETTATLSPDWARGHVRGVSVTSTVSRCDGSMKKPQAPMPSPSASTMMNSRSSLRFTRASSSIPRP